MLPKKTENELTVLKAYSQTQPISNIEQALSYQSDCLSGMKKKAPAETVLIVAVMIEMLSDFFNVTNTFKEEQRNETARLIINEFYWLKLVDIDLFFRRLKTGYYGEFYNRIDGQVVMAKLREYCEERAAKAVEVNLNKHKQLKDEPREMVCIRSSRGYIRSTGGKYEEVESIENATQYDYAVAARLILKLEGNPNEFKIVRAKQIGEKFFDYMMKTNPEKLTPQNRFAYNAKQYDEDKRKIESNPTLSDLEKHNAILALTGIAPKTEQEYLEYMKLINKVA